jgi:hypothetical protein
MNDTNNCGACGHTCMGATCTGGFCQGTEVLECSDGMPTIAGIDKTAGYIWANCGTTVTRAATNPPAILNELEYYPVTYGNGATSGGTLSNISFAQVVGSNIYWVEIHTNFDGGLAKQSTFVKTPTASNSVTQMFTIDGQVTDAAFDANHVYYDNPADSGNLWRFNLDGTGGVKIGPPASWGIAQDATNLYYSTADTISVTHGVRVAKAGGGVTTVVSDTGLPANTGNRWFFAVDATNFYYGELTSGQVGGCSMPGFGVYGGSLTGSGTSQMLVPKAFTQGLVADNGEVAWLGPDCTAGMTLLETYRPAGAILPIGGWTSFAPTTMIFDDTWLYYDTTNWLDRIPR